MSDRLWKAFERDVAGACSRCRDRARLPGQRWCRECLTTAQRVRRAARRAEKPTSAPTAPLSAPPSAVEARETAGPLSYLPAETAGVPGARSTPLGGANDTPAMLDVGDSRDAKTQALERYLRARAELDRVWSRWLRATSAAAVTQARR